VSNPHKNIKSGVNVLRNCLTLCISLLHKAEIMDQNSSKRKQVLKDLNNQMQIKAEQIKLLARIEPGPGDQHFQPNATFERPEKHEVQAIEM